MTASENLRRLAESATEVCDCGHRLADEHDESGCLYTTSERGHGCGCFRKDNQAHPRLIAAAPDMAVLLARALDALADCLGDGACDDPKCPCYAGKLTAILADADRLFGNDTEKEEGTGDEAWYHADFCHAYVWAYDAGELLRIKWGERDGSNLSLHRRGDCERCTALARGHEKARHGEFTMDKPPAEFSSLESFVAVMAEVSKWVPGLTEDAA